MLIKPIQALIPEKDEWIIIPDGFLYFLPFESLPAGTEDKTLLETTTISYQFSSRFMVSATAPGSGMRDHYDGAAVKVLAFAPFAGKGNGFDQEGQVWFSRLSASREEIAGLAGNQYFDSLATKDRFLKEINQYPIVHLATHAVSSIDDASKSFIAFYPKKGSTIEDCLFLEELYGLDMSSTKLVVISACETGQGELVSNEGVISVARAFAYAGCASTISSLWKADDQATSFILRRFYVHLKEGVSKARALQQAKLDYLKSGAINKSPAYWSHLILIGNTEPIYKEGTGRLWSITGVIIMIFLCILFWIVIKRKRKEGIRTKK
jgi:CHAT domain-containing protein